MSFVVHKSETHAFLIRQVRPLWLIQRTSDFSSFSSYSPFAMLKVEVRSFIKKILRKKKKRKASWPLVANSSTYVYIYVRISMGPKSMNQPLLFIICYQLPHGASVTTTIYCWPHTPHPMESVGDLWPSTWLNWYRRFYSICPYSIYKTSGCKNRLSRSHEKIKKKLKKLFKYVSFTYTYVRRKTNITYITFLSLSLPLSLLHIYYLFSTNFIFFCFLFEVDTFCFTFFTCLPFRNK